MAAPLQPSSPQADGPLYAARQRYTASLSTLWAPKNSPRLPEFLQSALQMGFTHVELNHHINSSMLSGLDLSQWPLSSLHEPCPADVPVEELKARDWLVSATKEEHRQHGVEAIKRSIDLAARLGLRLIVVHAGMVSTDTTLEQQLRTLFKAGRAGNQEYRDVQRELTEVRGRRVPACLDAVRRSLQVLLDYAAPFGVRLGLENRYHYYDIPSLDEIGELLAMADASRLGFVYDVGHAQHLDRLGFYAHEDWLRRYSSRIVEVHLHDVKGVDDHLAPGLGEVDFDMVAHYLPSEAIRTVELQPVNSAEQVRAGLRYLATHGCLQGIKN